MQIMLAVVMPIYLLFTMEQSERQRFIQQRYPQAQHPASPPFAIMAAICLVIGLYLFSSLWAFFSHVMAALGGGGLVPAPFSSSAYTPSLLS